MISNLLDHTKAAAQLGKELENEGYAVIYTPLPDHFPFSLEGYTPDLLASKGDSHLVVEINRRGAGTKLKLERASRILEKHPGWALVLKNVLDPEEPSSSGVRAEELPDLAGVETYFRRVRSGVEKGAAVELAVPGLWNTLMSLLRILAERFEVSHKELSDKSLINYLYTDGVISFDDYTRLLRWNELRNAAVHEVPFQADPREVNEMSDFAAALLEAEKEAGRAAGAA